MNRVALLGLGAAARAIHLPACREVGLRIVGGADPEADARRSIAKLLPDVPLFDSVEACLASVTPDWAFILSPPKCHRVVIEAALAAGCNVFCEKPFVPTTSDADAVISLARSLDRSLVVNHEFPFIPSLEAVVRSAKDGSIGRPLLFQAWQQVWDPPGAAGGWRNESRTFQEFGTHIVHLAQKIFGPVRAVTARMPDPLHAGVGDCVDLVTLEFDEGRAANLVLDRVCRGAHRYLDVRLDGERASIRASLGGRARVSLSIRARDRRPDLRCEFASGGLAWLEDGERRRRIARNPSNLFARATARHLSAVLAAPRGCASAEDARAVVAVVEAAYASALAARTVVLHPDPA